jgi:hypothetical protein
MKTQRELGSLGLLSRHCEKLPGEIQRKLQILEELNLDPEKWQLYRHMPEEFLYIDVIERELKRFLAIPVLVPQPEYSLAPPLLVDELWHILILNTPKYRKMCDEVYGSYLDHTPNPEGYGKELARTAGEIAHYTRTVVSDHFGSLVDRVWATDVMRPCQPDVVKCTWPPPPRLGIDRLAPVQVSAKKSEKR